MSRRSPFWGGKGDKQRGYIWAYASGVHENAAVVVYQVKEGRSGRHARDFLQHAPAQRAVHETGNDPPGIKRWAARAPLRGHRPAPAHPAFHGHDQAMPQR